MEFQSSKERCEMLGEYIINTGATVREAAKKACGAIECILSNDVNRAMNDYN